MASRDRLHIAILGTRGVPPRYGGFETFAGELGSRLVERGHRVTVYCRSALYPDGEASWRGIERIDLPAVRHKYLETVSHAFLSSLDALRRPFDVVLLCNAANAFVLPLLRAARIPVAINVDGVERRRKKWNVLGRFIYAAGEAMSVDFSDALIADADVIAKYYASTWSASSRVIAYGADFPDEPDSDVLERLMLTPRGYVLYVSRLEPENNPVPVATAWSGVTAAAPLIMVGDAPYSRRLIGELERFRSDRLLLPGALYGADYRTLQRNALLYIQATEVGGTHPAMIEALAAGGAVIANDTPENREVGGDAVEYFSLGERETLSALLQALLDDPVRLEALRERGKVRGRSYGWNNVVDAYEELFFEILR